MKKILGLDLGTTSIGWALVNEAENQQEKSSIIKLGVRVNPLTVDEQSNFEQGKSITTNAERTSKRSMRRNLQRYKLRRENLIEILKDNGFISDESILSENGNATTFQTYRLRAKAATEEITLEEISRVLLMINKKRGYKSSRKVKSDEDGQLIDGMYVAKQLYENGQTPGQYSLSIINKGGKKLPDYYRSDLETEFDRVFDKQMEYYPDILNEKLKEELRGKKRDAVWAICAKHFKENGFELVGNKRQGKAEDQKKENYEWRVKALSEKMELEQFVVIIQQINIQLNNSSGYLGSISDRSKELYFNRQTVGQYLMAELDRNPNFSLKNKVFYRQDYLDEFEKIWETQSRYHKELTSDLKKEIRDVVIFYQRPLKSQKGLISFCEFENKKIEVEVDGKKRIKTRGLRVCPKSSPLFQEFKIWQTLNNLQVSGKKVTKEHRDLLGNSEKTEYEKRFLEQEEKEILFAELSVKEKLSKETILKLLFENYKELDLNFREVDGNRTQAALFKAYQQIIELSGHGEYDFSKKSYPQIIGIVEPIFNGLGYNTEILHFNSSLEGKAFEQQPSYQLWHLLYSFEGDNSKTGNEKLIDKISTLYGFEKEYAKIIASVSLQPDYGSLSTKAMRKILPYMKDGNEYSVACEYARYRHSKNSLTKEELEKKVYKNKLELLPRNSLRNPVVEKILNQMINVVNGVVDAYGKPDEIRIELARELKKSAKERDEMTKAIAKTNAEHERYRSILQNEFGLPNVSRNDIIRYKLYLELEKNNFKTLYSNTYIPPDKLFSKEFDIEHIIPQAKLFDDSFSNKTIESRSVNIEKSNATAYDYVKGKYGEKGLDDYQARVEDLYKNGAISKTKFNKLLMKENDIPSGFIERDLRDSQYIAKKAREILEDMVKFVVPTTGAITDRLREDWQLVDVMRELNWNKYDKLGLTEYYQDKDGRQIPRIIDWTKRKDHRHHAMDALTIAFTKRSYIQYLNNLNARIQKGVDDFIYLEDFEWKDLNREERAKAVGYIEKKELYRDVKGKLRFLPPMPLNEFRSEAKRQLENTLISIKAKNKVVTQNVNVTKKAGGTNRKIQLTPRGQLHNETIYGSIKQYVTKEEKVGAGFNAEKIATVASPKIKSLLLSRLAEFDNDAKKAFTGKNSLDKNPIYLDDAHSKRVPDKVKTVSYETVYTIRKEVSPDLRIDKVIDANVRRILEARLKEYNGDAKKAFSNLDENPIWLNKEKGISIKRVTISGVSNAVALHDKRDKNGKIVLDEDGKMQPTDFVNTGNNHHIAIYKDAEGNLQENVVSFFEATTRKNLELPVIDKNYKSDEGWSFLFSMKQNEYFVFPNKETGFDPNEIDLLNPDNYALISPNLFRVQKITTKDYFFRHHLETTVAYNNSLKDITWKRCGLVGIIGIVKVRINHIGQIISVGEY